MKKQALCVVAFLLFTGISSRNTSASEETAIVTDLSGTVTVLHNGEKVPLDIGHALFVGDEILLTEGSTLRVVAYDDCAEWGWGGDGSISVGEGGFQTEGRVLKPSRTLPSCYSPDSFRKADSNTIGGFVLRGGPPDPAAPLRTEFAGGNASNSTLITLVFYESEKGNTEEARKYLDELQRRHPDSGFVKVLQGELEK